MLNICVIDDDIPIIGAAEADGRECITECLLQKLLERNQWGDTNLKDLLTQLADGDEWHPSAFVSPDIYLNAMEAGWPKPDIIVFDWDYKATSGESGELLVQVLQKSFAPIFIYTGQDKNGEVERRLALSDLNPYFNKRVFLLKKEEQNSSKRLREEAARLYRENFSFRVGAHLRRATADSVEAVLVALGEYHADFVREFLSEEETRDADMKVLLAEKLVAHVLEERSLFEILIQAGLDEEKAGNLLTLIKAKFRDEISSIGTGDWNLSAQTGSQDLRALQKMWSYRLYHTPVDHVVRKGDIIREKATGALFLITTPDCQLSRFWLKCCGYLTLVPLWDIATQASKIKTLLECSRDAARVKKLFKGSESKSPSELASFPGGWFVLPYVNLGGTYAFLLGFAKAVVPVQVDRNINADHLDFMHWNSFERVATLSEPFATPIIEHGLAAMIGHGTPDYPPSIKSDITNRLQKMSDILYPPPATGPAPAP